MPPLHVDQGRFPTILHSHGNPSSLGLDSGSTKPEDFVNDAFDLGFVLTCLDQGLITLVTIAANGECSSCYALFSLVAPHFALERYRCSR